MHFGLPVCASIYATRLFVVPRSIPTMRPIFSPTPLPIPLLRSLQDCECTTGGLDARSSAPCFSCEPRRRLRYPTLHPNPLRLPASEHLLRRVFRRSASPQRASFLLTLRHPIQPISPHAIRRATHSIQKLLRAAPVALA